jgi:hypothetical protein
MMFEKGEVVEISAENQDFSRRTSRREFFGEFFGAVKDVAKVVAVGAMIGSCAGLRKSLHMKAGDLLELSEREERERICDLFMKLRKIRHKSDLFKIVLDDLEGIEHEKVKYDDQGFLVKKIVRESYDSFQISIYDPEFGFEVENIVFCLNEGRIEIESFSARKYDSQGRLKNIFEVFYDERGRIRIFNVNLYFCKDFDYCDGKNGDFMLELEDYEGDLRGRGDFYVERYGENAMKVFGEIIRNG